MKKRLESLFASTLMALSLTTMNMDTTVLDITAYAVENSAGNTDINLIGSGTCGENVEWSLDKNGLLTISGSGTMSSYTSSSHAPWYSNNAKIKSVVVENGVTSIGDYAFYCCSSLTNVTLSDSITVIGNSIFRACSSLSEITIPSNVQSIGGYAFASSGLQSVTIPDSVQTLGASAFYGSTKLKEAIIGKGVKTISGYTFSGCSALETLTIPANVTFINASATNNCTALNEIRGYSESVAETYANNNNITFVRLDEPSVNLIGSGTCGENVEWSLDKNGLLTISGSGTMSSYTSSSHAPWYSNNAKIKSVVVENGVTSIGDYAFYCCSSLTNVTLSDSITVIGNSIFRACSSLSEITIPSNVQSIGGYAFASSGLQSVTIPDSVQTLGASAFYGSTKLKEAIIGKGVKTISGYTFSGCSALETLTIPANVTFINASATNNCTALNEIRGYSESVAETYANNNNITFVRLDELKIILFDFPSTTVIENDDVTFSITAKGAGNLTYQWQEAIPPTNESAPIDWSDVPNATTSSYTFKVKYNDNGKVYRCIVSNGTETVNSSVATLTVKPDNAVITNGTKEITINKGEAYQLDLVGKGLRYIANASNVTVDKYGVVNAKETGTGYVFVIDFYGHKCFYKIHVVEKYEELAFDEIEYNVMPGDSVRLYTNKNASYVISDTDRASVYTDWYEYNYCNVTCYIPGSYTVIAYNEYGELAFTTVNVEGNVTDIEVGTNYEGETDTNNSVWYKYVNDSDVEELITFDIEDDSNAAYVYYNQGSYSEPNYYWEDEIARNQMYVQPGDEVYVRMISDSDNAANYDFTVNIVPCASVDYTIGEELEDVVLDRDDYTEYSFTPDSSGEYELTAFSRNEFNWIITDSENNVVKNEYSNGAVYKTFNLKENENYTIRFTPNSMTETGSLTFEITKAEDNITVADVNTVYDTGIIRSGQTVYYKFEICKNSDNPAFDVFAFSREYSDYLSYTVLGSDMFTPYELHWEEGIAKLYFEEATEIYVKIENKSESADTPNFEIKQYEKTVTQLIEEAENTAEIGAYEADWYEFTAPENGNYYMNFGFDSYTDNFMPLNFEIYTGDDLVYDEDLSVYYMYDGYGFNHTMVKGEKLYVKVTGNCSENNENGAMSYNWSITSNQTYLLEELTLDTLTEGSTVNGKQTVFKFTAPVSGTYYFWSESKCNLYGNLSSMPNGDYIVGDDNSGYANNFCFAHRISAGETVYLNCHQIDNCDCEYNVMVSKTNRSQEYEPVFETIEMILDTPVSGYYENADGFDIFSFTAEMAGTYVFTSENAVDMYGNVADMYGELYSDDALTNRLTFDDDGSESYRQFRIDYELEEGQTVYLKPYNLSEYESCDYTVTVTKTEEMNETEILGTVDSFGDISTSSSFNTDSSSAIIQVNCMNSIPMDFYMLTNSEINMWTALSLESDDNRENEQTGIEFSFNYAPMADCYYIFIETTDGSSIGDIEVGYTYNELEPGYEDVCAECGGLNSEHTPDCSMGFVEDGSED